MTRLDDRAVVPHRCPRSPTSTTGRRATSRSSGWSAPWTSTSGCWATADSSAGATATSRSRARSWTGATLDRRGLRVEPARPATRLLQARRLREQRARLRAGRRRLDQADGKKDGKWRDNDIENSFRLRHPGAHAVSGARGGDGRQEREVRSGRHARPAVPELQGDRLRQPRLVHEPPGDGGRGRRPGRSAQGVRDLPEQGSRQGRVGPGAHRGPRRAMPDPAVSGGFQISPGRSRT